MNPIVGVILGIVGKLIADPAERARQQLAIMDMAQRGDLAELDAAVKVIVAEASGNWLQASWRPIMMLTFGGLIVARWFGFAAPNLAEAEYLELWGIVKLGIGGYVIGRSAEKIAPTIADAIKK